MRHFRSALFSLGFIASTLFFAVTCIVTILLPFRWRYYYISRWCMVNLWWLKVTCGITHHVEGMENIPPGPCIVLSKHQSTWETLAYAIIFPTQSWVMKKELMWVPFFGWGVALMQPIAIDRGSGHRAVQSIIEQGCRKLNEGRWVIIFPEGTRIPPGKRGRYGIGGPVLAEKSGRPVIPIAHNAGEFWPRRSFIKNPGVIRMVVGPPIDSTGRSAAEIRELAQQWIEGKMPEISIADYSGEPVQGLK